MHARKHHHKRKAKAGIESRRKVRQSERRRRRHKVEQEYGEAGIRMCGSKMAYPSKESALVNGSYRLGRGASFLRAYRCPICGQWHLTSH